MILVAIGATFLALGLFGLADQYRRGEGATIEAIVLFACGFGCGLGLIGAGIA